MAQLAIPEGGLMLAGAPGSSNANASSAGTKPPQAMRLDLADEVLEEILRASRNGGKGVHMSFGKAVVCEDEQYPSGFSNITNPILDADPTHWQQIPPAPRYSSAFSR